MPYCYPGHRLGNIYPPGVMLSAEVGRPLAEYPDGIYHGVGWEPFRVCLL